MTIGAAYMSHDGARGRATAATRGQLTRPVAGSPGPAAASAPGCAAAGTRACGGMIRAAVLPNPVSVAAVPKGMLRTPLDSLTCKPEGALLTLSSSRERYGSAMPTSAAGVRPIVHAPIGSGWAKPESGPVRYSMMPVRSAGSEDTGAKGSVAGAGCGAGCGAASAASPPGLASKMMRVAAAACAHVRHGSDSRGGGTAPQGTNRGCPVRCCRPTCGRKSSRKAPSTVSALGRPVAVTRALCTLNSAMT